MVRPPLRGILFPPLTKFLQFLRSCATISVIPRQLDLRFRWLPSLVTHATSVPLLFSTPFDKLAPMLILPSVEIFLFCAPRSQIEGHTIGRRMRAVRERSCFPLTVMTLAPMAARTLNMNLAERRGSLPSSGCLEATDSGPGRRFNLENQRARMPD